MIQEEQELLALIHRIKDKVDALRLRADNAEAEIERMRQAVKEHHSQKADDRCHLDDDKLYLSFGLSPADYRVGDKSQMLTNCARFIENRCEGGGWLSYVELESHLNSQSLRADNAEAEVARLQNIIRNAYNGDPDGLYSVGAMLAGEEE